MISLLLARSEKSSSIRVPGMMFLPIFFTGSRGSWMNPLWQIKAISGGGVLTPAQRKAGVRVRAAVKEDNCRINRLRSVVERVIAHIKTWWVIWGFSVRWVFYVRVFSSGAGVGVFCGFGPLMNKL